MYSVFRIINTVKMIDYINLQDISKRIKELQDRSGMTAKDFSAATDIPASTLSQINTGKILPSVDNINKIISKWSHLISPSWLLFGIEEMPSFYNTSTEVGLGTNPHGDQALSNLEGDNKTREVLLAQAEEIGRLKSLIENNKPKEIAHITVFYTDNSFATFHLNKDDRE